MTKMIMTKREEGIPETERSGRAKSSFFLV